MPPFSGRLRHVRPDARRAAGSAGSAPSAGPAATAAATTLHVTGVWRGVMYSRDRGWPKPGTTEVDVGLGRSTGGTSPPSTSVGVGRTTITGHPSRLTWTYKATQEEYSYGVGALRIALTGSFTIKGKWVVDKAKRYVAEGAGVFAGATGTITSTARNRVGARVITYKTDATYALP